MLKPQSFEYIDPIVEEVHAIRQRLLEEHGGLVGLFAYIRRQEQLRKPSKPISQTPATDDQSLNTQPDGTD